VLWCLTDAETELYWLARDSGLDDDLLSILSAETFDHRDAH
jgi:hypothetical protein